MPAVRPAACQRECTLNLPLVSPPPPQGGPPRGSTWDPTCPTPRGKSLQRLLHVAGDSCMFRPLYTGAQNMDVPERPVYDTV